MVDRIDHRRDRPSEELPEDAKGIPVSPALIEHLEALFKLHVDVGAYPGTMDHMVQVSHGVTYYAGQKSVLDYLKTLLENDR